MASPESSLDGANRRFSVRPLGRRAEESIGTVLPHEANVETVLFEPNGDGEYSIRSRRQDTLNTRPNVEPKEIILKKNHLASISSCKLH